MILKQDCFRRYAKKQFEQDCQDRLNEQLANTDSLQAGLRTLHEAGPELKRATSCDLEEAFDTELPPTRRYAYIYIPWNASDAFYLAK